ncbi:MAG TPA: YkgJ family cysteine cluster protein [Candidatus Omnitrophota bacterium]|nr:YkgJ family cysteine cluster protein [Candidatus Omnitrophota bacterium]HPS19379.1 YkgJ family cysteine cluster protein [Candidatus Omnitrophota bacterium]
MDIPQIVTSRFCFECKGCCKFFENNSAWVPHLSSDEIKALKAKGAPEDFFDGKTIKPAYLREAEIFLCRFLNFETSKCKMYDIRPFECRLYPYLLNLDGKKIFLAADPYCPYVKKNARSKAFKKFTERIIAFLNEPATVKFIKKNMHLANSYNNVINLVQIPLK